MKSPRQKRRLVAEINVVPYIDVMLVLLIVFMVTAPLLMQGVKVELPQAPSAPLEDKDLEPLIVSVKADGTYYLDLGNGQNEQQSLDVIVDKVKKVMGVQPKTPVLVWGDKAVDYGTVVQLMSQLQGAGAPSVGLVTEPPGRN
ncbi:protein TolR [Porticoccus litoralis]|jgi:biopolymer transport protein TolR|uniref:Tol-Pal system protein TolR n=1 Tax=Porticoccus litoralis TaxID=434086 RepID=A0AAW8B489_9GAMM|nr:protein TolR [Porticoccus litoralis]MDP1520557.1 protein TolR [Porticoccus litoralis]TNE93149.1 MAG: protein TolR [Gammaproteobacteria bacterium]